MATDAFGRRPAYQRMSLTDRRNLRRLNRMQPRRGPAKDAAAGVPWHERVPLPRAGAPAGARVACRRTAVPAEPWPGIDSGAR